MTNSRCGQTHQRFQACVSHQPLPRVQLHEAKGSSPRTRIKDAPRNMQVRCRGARTKTHRNGNTQTCEGLEEHTDEPLLPNTCC